MYVDFTDPVHSLTSTPTAMTTTFFCNFNQGYLSVKFLIMKQSLLILSLIISGNIFSQQPKDSIEIIQLLEADYKTMVTMDIKKHMANCTEDYLLIENGEIWTMKKEADYYKKNANRVIERKDHFDFTYIKILGNTAYAVYSLRSAITENGVLTQKNWNESVIFRKVNGKWKIALIHSTPIKS